MKWHVGVTHFWPYLPFNINPHLIKYSGSSGSVWATTAVFSWAVTLRFYSWLKYYWKEPKRNYCHEDGDVYTKTAAILMMRMAAMTHGEENDCNGWTGGDDEDDDRGGNENSCDTDNDEWLKRWLDGWLCNVEADFDCSGKLRWSLVLILIMMIVMTMITSQIQFISFVHPKHIYWYLICGFIRGSVFLYQCASISV